MVDEWRISSHTFEAEPLTKNQSISENVLQTLPRFTSLDESELDNSSDRKTFIIEPYMSASTIRLVDKKIEQGISVPESRMELEKTSTDSNPLIRKSETDTQSQTDTHAQTQTDTHAQTQIVKERNSEVTK